MKKKARNVQDLLRHVNETKALKINFSLLDERLTEIPEQLFDMSSLEEIDFGAIPIHKFSKKIERLNKLKKISIYSTELEKFPTELLNLPLLEEVTLESKNILELPVELNNWDSLRYLNVGNSQSLATINGLPKNLKYLHIGGTGITKLPDLICSLNLFKIVLHELKLRAVPNEICEMKSLRALFIAKNSISSLPTAIEKLENLRELVMYENEFTIFPEVLAQLKNLKRIEFSRNHLTDITCDISSLKALETFDLGNNNLSEIPIALRSLESLESLDVSNAGYLIERKNTSANKIRLIPNWIVDLPKLESFEIRNNLIENIPAEILDEGILAIKNYILSKGEADKEELLCEAKMVVVGRGNVGKSVLTKKLTLPGYSLTNSDTTKGIDILKSPFIFPIEISGQPNSFKFNIWDFGGQEKYDATHQLFITSRTVYLFLTEAREESNYSDFQFWLNTIRLFSNNSPVIIVLSKCDERRKLLPESIYLEQFENIVKFVEISCADGYEETIEDLKKAIAKAILLLPQTKQTLSNRWIDIRKELERRSLKRDYISYNNYLSICKKHKLNKRQADFLSQYLNDLGVIVHHQYDLLLKKTVFINTDWCVDGMYKVLDDETVLKQSGKFSNDQLQLIWADKRFVDKQEELVKLMKEYDLCFELKDSSAYIAPDLLPPDKKDGLTWNSDQNLQFEYRYDFMPSGILSRFIVKSHSFIKDEIYWRHGVVLEYENTLALVQEDYINKKIKIALRGENKKGLLSAIRMSIDEVHKDFNKTNKLLFEEMVPCNCVDCSNSLAPHFYKFNVLKKFEQGAVENTTCEKSVRSVKIKSLISDVQIKNPLDFLETNEDLKNFIVELIDSVLERDIVYKGGFINFWRDQHFTEPKNETEIQPYISNVLDNFCKVKGINLSREVKEANGSVDIIFSCTNRDGKILKVCVEIKKAHHQDIETAIKTQLPLYMKSADTDQGIYLVIWFKHQSFSLPKKYETEEQLFNLIKANSGSSENISIKILNCAKKESPSIASPKGESKRRTKRSIAY